jgi:hypothetical protein
LLLVAITSPSQSAIPTKGRALLRPNGYGATKKTHGECLKFVQGK